MTQENQTVLDDRQIDIASHSLANAVGVLVDRGQIEGLEKEATRIAEALVAGLRIIQASCSGR